MICHDDRYAVEFVKAFAHCAERFRGIEKVFGRGRAEANDVLGFMMSSCLLRKPLQLSASLGSGVRFPGRPAFENVADVDLLAVLESAGGDDLVEQLTRCANKGEPLGVFVGARRFAEEADFGARLAIAEDRLRACGGELGAAGTRFDLGGEDFQLLAAVGE